MLIALIALGLYAIAVSVFAAVLFGQQQMMETLTLETKRDKRREIRRSTQYLEALMRKSGTPLYRPTQPEQTSDQKPSRRIVTPSMVISRQRDEDDIRPTKLKLEPVPPAIKAPFLRDAASNGAAGK